VFNDLGEVRCRAKINPELRPGVAVLPKGLWARHTLNGQTANALVPDTLTDLGGGACFNDARVEIERVERSDDSRP
jgi:anaerobic selenocysteine-containing dehydrogenase